MTGYGIGKKYFEIATFLNFKQGTEKTHLSWQTLPEINIRARFLKFRLRL